MQNILITGGSGLLGRQLTIALHRKGYQVAWLSRKASATTLSVNSAQPDRMFKWDIAAGFIDMDALLWSDAIIHLAGEGIADKRWTPARKKVIIESRTRTTELLITAMKSLPQKKHVVLAASAIGYYGPSEEVRREEDKAGKGFLAYSVSEWEKSTAKFEEVALRTVVFRIGIVLSSEGGAYPELLQTKWMRVLPLLGGGKQMYPWVHIDDIAGIFLFTLEHQIRGVFNAVAPNPVTQGEIMRTYSKVKGGWYFRSPVPAFFLRLLLGEMADMVLLTQQVSAKKIMDAGYDFMYPDIASAITDLEKK